MDQAAAAWIQAIGSILAILAGFGVAWYQSRLARRDARQRLCDEARAAGILCHKALAQLAERLEVAGKPYSKAVFGMALRELRTTELIEALRQFDLRALPPDIISQFVSLRTNLYAVNRRITDVYRSEEAEPAKPEEKRERRLRSAFKVFDMALADYAALIGQVKSRLGLELPPCTISDRLRTFIDVAGQSATLAEAPIAAPEAEPDHDAPPAKTAD